MWLTVEVAVESVAGQAAKNVTGMAPMGLGRFVARTVTSNFNALSQAENLRRQKSM